MPRTCLACQSTSLRTVDQKLKAGSGHSEVSAWLAARGESISRQAIARHAAHIGLAPHKPGPRPVSGDFLTQLRDRVHADMTAGDLRPTVTHGLAAQQQLDHRAERQSDRDLMLQMAQILGGGAAMPPVIEGEYAEWDASLAEGKAEMDRWLNQEPEPTKLLAPTTEGNDQ